VKLHLEEWGDRDAPPVVCLHGVTGRGELFRRLAVEGLHDFRVLAPDLRGHGRSGSEPPWRLRTFVADVVETLEAAGVERAAWVGHSFGGRLVIELVAAQPERVERAVLLDPAIRIRPDRALILAEGTRPSPDYCRSTVVAIFGELAAWGPAPEDLAGPLLLVLGADESVVGPRQLERYRLGLGDRLQVTSVPGGHDVLVDAFAETAAATRAFLGGAA
jgi:lipase